jgi:hypothetical protein
MRPQPARGGAARRTLLPQKIQRHRHPLEDHEGSIQFQHGFAGHSVGIKEVHDDIWLVSFSDADTTWYPVGTNRLQTSTCGPFDVERTEDTAQVAGVRKMWAPTKVLALKFSVANLPVRPGARKRKISMSRIEMRGYDKAREL